MKLKIEVRSSAYDTDYGGEQEIEAACGEYRLDGIFRLPFFRVVIDEIIGGAVCFRLMEGGVGHYFVLEEEGECARFERETSIGSDSFVITLIK